MTLICCTTGLEATSFKNIDNGATRMTTFVVRTMGDDIIDVCGSIFMSVYVVTMDKCREICEVQNEMRIKMYEIFFE